jgi:hypothetical protein
MTYDGAVNPGSLDPADLPSTITTSFTATGSDSVVIRFIALADTAVHRQFAVVNGFELTGAVNPEVTLTSVDFDGGEFDVTGSGFTIGAQYVLRRSLDGIAFDDVGAAFPATGNIQTRSDPSPPPGRALYQFSTP